MQGRKRIHQGKNIRMRKLDYGQKRIFVVEVMYDELLLGKSLFLVKQENAWKN
jgi:hypothetical protein